MVGQDTAAWVRAQSTGLGVRSPALAAGRGGGMGVERGSSRNPLSKTEICEKEVEGGSVLLLPLCQSIVVLALGRRRGQLSPS